MLTTAGDGSGVGGGSERGGEDEDILTDQQAELIPGQSLDEVIDSETLGRLQLRSCVWLCVWWVVGVVGWVVWWVWWVHMYSPCIKTDSHCYMHHWSVFCSLQLEMTVEWAEGLREMERMKIL